MYQQELGLLCDVASIIEQMKALSRSRGMSTEALADAHVSEMENLKKEHTAEMETVKRHHAEEVIGLARKHAVSIPAAELRSVTEEATDGIEEVAKGTWAFKDSREVLRETPGTLAQACSA